MGHHQARRVDTEAAQRVRLATAGWTAKIDLHQGLDSTIARLQQHVGSLWSQLAGNLARPRSHRRQSTDVVPGLARMKTLGGSARSDVVAANLPTEPTMTGQSDIR